MRRRAFQPAPTSRWWSLFDHLSSRRRSGLLDLVVPVKLSEPRSFFTCIERVQRDVFDAMDHADCGAVELGRGRIGGAAGGLSSVVFTSLLGRVNAGGRASGVGAARAHATGLARAAVWAGRQALRALERRRRGATEVRRRPGFVRGDPRSPHRAPTRGTRRRSPTSLRRSLARSSANAPRAALRPPPRCSGREPVASVGQGGGLHREPSGELRGLLRAAAGGRGARRWAPARTRCPCSWARLGADRRRRRERLRRVRVRRRRVAWPTRGSRYLGACGFGCVVTQPEHAAHAAGENVFVVDDATSSRDDPFALQRAPGLAYVVFTSGSTGTPKGVP